ncbi:MAG: pyrroline-5-carboxylate reductase dimerization domain-containing protein [Bdellovibrionota bacterium]
MKVLVVGAGKMVESILAGLPADAISPWGIVSKSGVSAKNLANMFGMQFVEKVEDFQADWILLGCKPQQLKEIKIPNVPVMSLLAAISEQTQKEILKVTHLVRVMPNLPVKHKSGVILLSSSSKQHLKMPEELFSKLGLTKIMDEKELEELTLLTGSGPALFYEFAKTLAESFKSLSESEREVMVKAVLQGSAASLNESSLQSMIDAVTSKGGVTIAVLEEWRKKDLGEVLKSGIVAGEKRTDELKAHLLQN